MPTRFLQQLVDNPDRGPGRVFAWFIQIVIIVSILDFTIETMPSISPTLRSSLWLVEVVSIAIFTVEFLLRVCFSKKGIRYASISFPNKFSYETSISLA
ncbi:hypothetical protein [Pelagicoccus sp. SDUM812003]|uniref:hypothetical protein n=1 Tax=Pelagicoccus sp. SDUM812003 TaxID=3041267 RepID=UPI0028106BA2|nr:hypothetical protein [Pelagicoccus sp. SDUM812003]MDQ8204211.1 hypothetical protein [Pelagicoccus sp. SDUM812003]